MREWAQKNERMKDRPLLLLILIILLMSQVSWADSEPWTKEDEIFAQAFLEKVRIEKPELFRSGTLLSKEFVNAQFTDEDGAGWVQYNFEYRFSSGWCIAKVFILDQKGRERQTKYEIHRTSKSVNGYEFEFSGDETIRTEGSDKYFVKKYEDGEERRAWITDERNTAMGKVRVVEKEYKDKTGRFMHSTVVLNHEEVFESQANDVNLYGIFLINGTPHVLIGENCGGSGCRFDELGILILHKDKAAKVIRRDDFYSEDNKIKATSKGNKIFINLGLYKGKVKTAVYSDDRLRIFYKKLPYKPLTAGQCADLYTIAEGCATLREIKEFTCEKQAVGYDGRANSETWDLRYLSNEPGFNQRLFDKECLQACRAGRLSDHKDFARRVCGR